MPSDYYKAKIFWAEEEKNILSKDEEIRTILHFEEDVSSYWGVIIRGVSEIGVEGEQVVEIAFFVPEGIDEKINQNLTFHFHQPIGNLLIAKGKFLIDGAVKKVGVY